MKKKYILHFGRIKYFLLGLFDLFGYDLSDKILYPYNDKRNITKYFVNSGCFIDRAFKQLKNEYARNKKVFYK